MHMSDRKSVRVICTGREAVRREGEGKGEDVNGNVTCESALREVGVDEALIAKKLKEQLDAKQPRWNPEKKAFELFADNNARLAAIKEAIKIFGGYPSADDTGRDRNLIVHLGPLTPTNRERADNGGSASQ
jgi:hypothetical protein